MRIRQSMRRTRRRSRAEGANWLSFSDLMSALLLIFILIMFYIMYQYFDMYEINMAEIARQQYDLDQANASLDDKTARLTLAEQQMIAQQIKLDAAQKELTDAEAVLAAQQQELTDAQSLLSEKEGEIAAQQSSLDALSAQLTDQQAQIQVQQQTLSDQQTTMDQQRAQLQSQQATMETQRAQLESQQTTMNQQQVTLDQQQTRLQEQQQALEQQQVQIEQLVGLRTRIISSLSEALRTAKISAQVDPTSGAIALKSDVLFATNRFELTEAGQAFIDRFLPVYLNVLLSDEYRPYVSEIIIEGHTDSAGDYITNLKLSQQRALAVASYVLDDDYHKISAGQKRRLRALATANGRSWSDPVLDSQGHEDMDASRRVVFKFRMTDEQMIQQLKGIMERNGD